VAKKSMKKNKVRPNEPCPCGSGRKFKKCCRDFGQATGDAGVPHTPAERASAFDKLAFFIDELWEDEEEMAFEEFWGRHIEREEELPPELRAAPWDVQDMWFAFDYRLADGRTVADHFLEQAPLSPGERSFLLAMRRSSMRLYEVIDKVPGTSMTLRDLLAGTVVTVNERTASRSLARHECLAARVIARGTSGGPEIERGLLHIPRFWRDSVVAAARELCDDVLRVNPGTTLDEACGHLPPLFLDVWVKSIFEPAIPQLKNTDGEDFVITCVSFHVEDAAALQEALDAAEGEGIERAGDGRWSWSGPNVRGETVSLASLALGAHRLRVEANSVERGARARALVERLAGAAIRHRSTTHEDPHRRMAESVTARALGREGAATKPHAPALDPDLADALALELHARHYRAWIDEPVPKLDDRTPREAAKIPALRPRLEDMLHELEGMYEHALADGQPAYDPSWMWAELELRGEAEASHPPLLAHERVAQRVPGSAEAARAAAERFRAAASFSDVTTTVGEDELRRDLDLQQFLRKGQPSATEEGQAAALAAPYVRLMVNLELHRRKVFWVDASLSYMLEHTEVDVSGGELRVPFPSFAIVLTDRHALSLGERLLARKASDPLRGQLLRVIAVYVTEEHRGDDRVLAIVFALDALGADLPSLVRYEVPAGDESSVRAFLDSIAPPPPPELLDANPARRLLRLVLNAILYATSAGVIPDTRTAPRQKRRRPTTDTPPRSSDTVYFLPGQIDIRRVRLLQEVERAPEGRALFARFMVRGHWRRAQKGWADQRMRWIEPYWKGPDMATVLERAYRLKP
jgi:hypothetical protein